VVDDLGRLGRGLAPGSASKAYNCKAIYAGLKLAIERGWLELHESGTYVKFTQSGAEDLFV
jgi:hypothetical protein